MGKLLLSTDETLYRRLDASYYEVARDRMLELMDSNPEYKASHIRWSLKLEERNGGSFARLQIKAVDRSAFYVSPGIVVALFVTVLVILSAIFGWGWE